MSIEQFLVEDYKLKVDYLVNHFSRMWNRFSFFVTIESAILTALLAFLQIPQLRDFAVYLAGLGLLIGLVWWVAGSEDRFLVTVYRGHVEQTADRIRQQEAFQTKLADYASVGSVPDDLFLFASPVEWRLRWLSITRLAGLVPLLVSLIWLVVILTWSTQGVTNVSDGV